MTKRFIFFIAGFQYYQGPALVLEGKLRRGNKLHLIREPENKHDAYAISIWKKEVKLGYVPKLINRQLTGAKAGCVILKVKSTAKPWEMCKVLIELESSRIEIDTSNWMKSSFDGHLLGTEGPL